MVEISEKNFEATIEAALLAGGPDDPEPRFLQRLSIETERGGALDVLRKGIKDVGARIQLAYFRPASGLNPELQKKYLANIFSVVRQLKYSLKNENSPDVG